MIPATLDIPADVLEIARRLEEAGHEAWCVGGAVRDRLLGHGGGDFDIATSARPEEVQRLFRRTVPVGLRFGTVGVLDRERRLHEVTTFRRDVTTDGRHAVVEYGASLDDDLARRDFTMNAIAYHPLRHEWRDPYGGADAIDARLVQAVGDPAARFREDYLRILRGLRFAARFEFAIEPATWQAMQQEAPGLARLSAERVRDEWFKSLRTARDVVGLVELWHASGAAAARLPELRDTAEARALAGIPAPGDARDPVLLTVALCTDPAGVLERLRASGAEIGRARAVADVPREPAGEDDRAVRHWLHAAGAAADDRLALWRLETGKPAPWARRVEAIRTRGEPLDRRDLAVSGDDLRAAGVPTGPALGDELDRLLALVLDDPALNQRDLLLARVRRPE